MADLIDIFGEDFTSVLASLDKLPPEVETMLLGVMDKMIYDVKTFSNSLEKTVFSMTQAGVAPNMIKETLANDMETGGSIFGKLRNDTKASIVDGINQSAKMGQYENYDLDKGQFAWVTVGGHKVCGDCDGRAGITLTFKEWEAEGLPGSGWSVCKGFCYCVLDPTGQMSKKVDAPVSEKGAKKAKSKIPTLSKAQADELAMKFFNMAKKQDPDITGLAERLALETGSKLHGLDHRLKTPRSISRKIIKENVENGVSYSRMAKEDLSDINRYTFILDEVTYVDDYNSIINKFIDEGYDVVKVKNYWDGDEYRGLNVNLRALDGRKIEMQFNTARSQHIKDKYSHKWYEEARDINTTAKRKAEIKKLATEKWNTVNKPVGWDEIDWYPPKIPVEKLTPKNQTKTIFTDYENGNKEIKKYFTSQEKNNPRNIQLMQQYAGNKYHHFNRIGRHYDDEIFLENDRLFKQTELIGTTRNDKGVLFNLKGHQEWKGAFNELKEFLNKTPDFNGTSYRGIRVKQDQIDKFLDRFQDNNIVKSNSFWSSTAEKNIAEDFLGGGMDEFKVVFEIRGKTGTILDEYVQFVKEKEVLFNVNTKFRVKSIKMRAIDEYPNWHLSSDNPITIILEEV